MRFDPLIDPFFEKWQRAKEESRATVAAGNQALMDQMALGEEELFQLTEEFNEVVDPQLPTNIVGNLNLTEKTSVAVVLRMLAEVGKQNILIGEGVTQQVEVSVHDTPWDQAFKSLLGMPQCSTI